MNLRSVLVASCLALALGACDKKKSDAPAAPTPGTASGAPATPPATPTPPPSNPGSAAGSGAAVAPAAAGEVRIANVAPKVGARVLAVEQLSLPRQDQFGVDLQGVSLQVHAGEVVGIAGVSGNGQQELMAALSGEDLRAPAGTISLFGQDISRDSPRKRRKEGLHFVPEERLGRGAVPTLSLAQNTLLTRTGTVERSGWIRTGEVTRLAQELIARFNVKAGGAGAAIYFGVCVLLRVEAQLSYEEIAAVLGLGVSNAKVRVHRARLRLGKSLEDRT